MFNSAVLKANNLTMRDYFLKVAKITLISRTCIDQKIEAIHTTDQEFTWIRVAMWEMVITVKYSSAYIETGRQTKMHYTQYIYHHC